MSGVVKDDSNPNSPPEETVSAVGDAEAGHADSTDATETEIRALRRNAPHLRVVADNEDAAFISPPVPLFEQPNLRIGAVIKGTRETLGYSLDQVSKEIRVHLSHLRAIEEMTPNLLGAPVYAKGYIKAYARHLGLDEQTTLDRYLKECAILKDPVKHTIAPPSTGRKLPAAVPVFGFLIVALLGAAGYFFFANGDRTTSAPQVASATPAPPPQQGGAPAIGVIAVPPPAATQQLRVVALKRELLEVRSADGTKYLHRQLEPGETYTPRLGSDWTVSTPDGAAFEWRLGDQQLGLLSEGGPVNAQNVDLAAQRTPIVVETPPIEVAAPLPGAIPPDGAATPPGSASATTSGQLPAAATTTTPPKPRPQRPRPPPVETPPVAEALPATTPVAPPVTAAAPAQDPALAAYPDQPPPSQ